MKNALWILGFFLFAANTAQAAEFYALGIETEIEGAYGIDSDEDDKENVTLGSVYFEPSLYLGDALTLSAVINYEQTQSDGNGSGGDFLDNNGLSAEELYLAYERNGLGITLGKFNPRFGAAVDFSVGVHSDEFVDGYELLGKIGVGVGYALALENIGTHEISAATFFTDTSALGSAAGTNNDRVRKSSGGASNTGNFNSFTLAVDGTDIGGIENLSYHLGYRHLEAGDADSGTDEYGFVAAVQYSVPVYTDITTDIVLEYANIHNFSDPNGADATGQDIIVYTIGTETILYDDWAVSALYSRRDVTAGGDTNADHLAEVTLGYYFDNGFEIKAGWLHEDVADIATHNAVVKIAHTIEF